MRRLVILGAGESGVGAAILGKKHEYQVFVSDAGKISPNYQQMLNSEQIEYEQGGHSIHKMVQANLVVKSPGIPDDAHIVQVLREHQRKIISEIEFASRFTEAKTICITGSNGKTTTTMLLYDILKQGGYNVGVAGNIGDSFALSVARDSFDYYVLEISSFQIDGLDSFQCDAAVILNITPDHLDRYDNDFSKYVDSKLKLARHIKPEGKLVLCADDPHIVENMHKHNTNDIEVEYFSLAKGEQFHAHLEHDNLVLKTDEGDFRMLLSDLSLKGKHNVFNSMAAAIVSKSMGVRNKSIRKSLENFQNIAHRLEYVLKIRDVEFINDSKATNVNATWYALECMKKPVIWIAGGTDKGNDYSELDQLVSEKVKAIVCLSADTAKFQDYFQKFGKPILFANSMEEAVQQAYEMAQEDDVVLLSPACASFDRFKNYMQRGNAFKEIVKKL